MRQVDQNSFDAAVGHSLLLLQKAEVGLHGPLSHIHIGIYAVQTVEVGSACLMPTC